MTILINNDMLSNIILFLTFLAIIWYTVETRELRKWQKMQTLLSIFFEQTKGWNGLMQARTKYPIKLREIYEKNEYDPKWAYSTMYHAPLSETSKSKITQLLIKIYKLIFKPKS